MKKLLLTAFILTVFGFYAGAQTKGTNTLGLGLNFSTQKAKLGNNSAEIKQNIYSIGYGNFIKDNTRLGISASFTNNSSQVNDADQSTTKGYGGSVNYQKYYPLLKKFYAFAGGSAGYNYSKTEQGTADVRTSLYSLGANGGVTYFVSKRFAFESSLLSAAISYSKGKEKDDSGNPPYSNTSTQFNLSSSGAINNLAFSIYFLF